MNGKSIEQYWYDKRARVPWWLKSMTPVFRGLVATRQFAYRHKLLNTYRSKMPVIVVGNITVGGTGKTPVVVWLVNLLKDSGYHPGVVSRGYGGKATHWPQQVNPDSDAAQVGDESVLIARRCNCPMMVAPSRVEAIKKLEETFPEIDVIVSDDGMQHYAMGRDMEISVVDGTRRFGNGYCLPAGPLREPISRLAQVDFRIVNSGGNEDQEWRMELVFGRVINLANPGVSRTVDEFTQEEVYAVAGIGNPQRFFDQLKVHGIKAETCAFPDHHVFSPTDFRAAGERDILMTEKDAVKCEKFAKANYWYVSVEAKMPDQLKQKVISSLKIRIAQRN